MGVFEPLAELGTGDFREPLEVFGWLPLGEMAGLLLGRKRRISAERGKGERRGRRGRSNAMQLRSLLSEAWRSNCWGRTIASQPRLECGQRTSIDRPRWSPSAESGTCWDLLGPAESQECPSTDFGAQEASPRRWQHPECAGEGDMGKQRVQLGKGTRTKGTWALKKRLAGVCKDCFEGGGASKHKQNR